MTMTLTRTLTLPAKGAAEFIVGLAMMAAPAILRFPTAGILLGVTLGAILTGKGLATAAGTARRPLDVRQFDSIYILATAAAALATALEGQVGATVMLASVVAVESILSLAVGTAAAPQDTTAGESRSSDPPMPTPTRMPTPMRKSGPSPGYRPSPTLRHQH
jgi:hypothetical protein